MTSADKAFWDIVGEPADPNELNEGDLFRLEFGGLKTVKRVVETWVDGRGLKQMRIADAPPGDYTGVPMITIVVPRQ